MILGSALAKPLFLILFGDIWLPAVPFFQLLCFTGILYPVHSYNLNILNVFGRSDLFLRLEIIKKFQVLVLIGVAFQFGVLGLIFAQIIASATSFAINTYFTGKFISYGFWDQSSDILPMILIGLGLGFVTWLLVEQFQSLGIGNLLQLIFLIPIGISMYFTACLLLGIPPAQDLVNFTKSKISK
jgi:O-antigen/teichoic acid export membrane protein